MTEDRFTDITTQMLLGLKADHGVHWVDFDTDGDLDLSLTGAGEDGMHNLVRNMLDSERSNRSLQVIVLDEKGHFTKAGSEIRVYRSGNEVLLGSRILDTGSGYNSQNAMPVHFGLGNERQVDIEVTVMTNSGRKSVRLSNVDPLSYTGRYLTVKINGNGEIVK